MPLTPSTAEQLRHVPGEGTLLDVAPIAALANRLAPAPYNDRFQYHYGNTLTPQTVSGVLQNADTGYLWMLADLLDEARERDGHMHAELQKRELRVAGSDWELVPPEGSGAAGEEIAKWCGARLREIESLGALSRDFGSAIADLMGAVYQGRVGLEVVWRDERGWMVPGALYFLHPRRFTYAADWRLRLWDASGTSPTSYQPVNTDSPFGMFPGLPLDRFPAGKFIAHNPRVRGVMPTREGLGRLLVWWCTFKRFAVRDFAAFAEWAGRGLRVGTFATGRGPMGEFPASEDDRAVLQQVLDAMSSSNAATFADTTKVDVMNAPSNNDVHSDLIALCNAEQSKAVVGGTLGSESSRGGGTRALGEVHERNELMIARADANAVGSTLVRDLVRPMVRMNFGERAPVPRMRFAVDPAQDLDAVAKRIQIFTGLGGDIAQADARNLLNLPDPSPGAPLLGIPTERKVEDYRGDTAPQGAAPNVRPPPPDLRPRPAGTEDTGR